MVGKRKWVSKDTDTGVAEGKAEVRRGWQAWAGADLRLCSSPVGRRAPARGQTRVKAAGAVNAPSSLMLPPSRRTLRCSSSPSPTSQKVPSSECECF